MFWWSENLDIISRLTVLSWFVSWFWCEKFQKQHVDSVQDPSFLRWDCQNPWAGNHPYECQPSFLGVFPCCIPLNLISAYFRHVPVSGFDADHMYHGQDTLQFAGWWFGCHQFYFPINIGNLIIPTDELHHFSEGWPWVYNHQPVCQKMQWSSSDWWPGISVMIVGCPCPQNALVIYSSSCLTVGHRQSPIKPLSI